MAEKILTVIIPMYNAKPWIRHCLHSLLVRPEERQYLEALIINDGSEDGCEKIAEKYEKEYPGLFFTIHKENGGHGSAINVGVSAATGKYMKVLDADDWLDTRELERFLGELRRLDGPDMILCGYQTFDAATGKVRQVRMGGGSIGRCVGMGGLVAGWQQYRPACTFHGIAYRTEFYRRSCGGLPEGIFYDDGYYSIVPASYAKKIYLSGRCLYVYRIGRQGQSVSAENRVLRLGDAKQAISAVCASMHGKRMPQGQGYWQRRTESLIADYLATCFLRFTDRKAGRLEAGRFMGQLWKKYPSLACAVLRKYRILKCMGYLHVSERQLQKLLEARMALWDATALRKLAALRESTALRKLAVFRPVQVRKKKWE